MALPKLRKMGFWRVPGTGVLIRLGRVEDRRAKLVERGQGRYRRTRIVGSETIEKREKPVNWKNYGPFQILVPTKQYVRFKYGGTKTLNQREFDNYKAYFETAPEGIRDCFAMVKGIRKENGENILSMELVKDSDGKKSRTLNSFGTVKSELFWKKFAELEGYLKRNRISLLNLDEYNILVKRLNEKDAVPVVIDYKLAGREAHIFQPHSWTEKSRVAKVNRKTKRIREKFKPRE